MQGGRQRHALAVHVLVGEAVQGRVQLCWRGTLIQAQGIQVGQEVAVHLPRHSAECSGACVRQGHIDEVKCEDQPIQGYPDALPNCPDFDLGG